MKEWVTMVCSDRISRIFSVDPHFEDGLASVEMGEEAFP